MTSPRPAKPSPLLRCLYIGVRTVLVLTVSLTLVLLFALWSLASLSAGEA